MRFQKYVPGFLTVIILFLYAPSIRYDFISYWDNAGYSYVYDNPLSDAFSTSHLKQVFSQSFDQHYHPLTLIFMGIEHALFGTGPAGYHAVGMLLFIFITIGLFHFISLLTRDPYAALFTALFFAVHPFNAESVLWVSEQKNLLFMVFLMPALIFYVRFIDSERRSYLWLSALFFALSLLSKSQGLPFIAIVFLIDYFRGRKTAVARISEKWMLLAVALLFLLLTFQFHDPSGFSRTHPSAFADYFFSGFRNLFFYLSRSLVPFDMSPWHPYPDAVHLASQFWYDPLIVIAAVAFILWYFRKNKAVVFGFLFFVLAILPLLKFVSIPYGNYIAADRYFILPLAGMGLALCSAGAAALARRTMVLRISAGVVLTVFAIITISFRPVWSSDEAFYKHLTERHPELKSGWGNRGRIAMANGKYEEAIGYFTELIHLEPSYSNAYLNRGLAYAKNKRPGPALADFTRAIQYDTLSHKAYSNRALLLMQLNKPEDALHDITRSLRIFPEFTEGWINKTLIEIKLKRQEAAETSLIKAMQWGFSDQKIIRELQSEIRRIRTSGS